MFSFAKKLVDKLEGVNGPEIDTYYKNTLIRNNGYALRVMHVEPESQASKLGFESWFDYIVGFADHDLPIPSLGHSSHSYLIGDDGSFNFGTIPIAEQARMVDFDMVAQELATIATSPNPHVKFEVWNAKGGVLRIISVPLVSGSTVSTTLPQSDILNLHRSFQGVGLTVQSQHISSASVVYKILTSQPGSPAFRAALVPHSDYVIGCDSAFPTDENETGLLTGGGESALLKTILSYYKKHLEILQDDRIPIVLIVYNHDYDIVRKVTVHLSRSWSSDRNKGLLGCGVGYGLLHRLPLVVGKFDSAMNVLSDELYQNDDDYSYKLSEKQSSFSETRGDSKLPPPAQTVIAHEQIVPALPPAPITPSPKKDNPSLAIDINDLSLAIDDDFLVSPTGDSGQAIDEDESSGSQDEFLLHLLSPKENFASVAQESLTTSLVAPMIDTTNEVSDKVDIHTTFVPPSTVQTGHSHPPPPPSSLQESKVNPGVTDGSGPPPPPLHSLSVQQGPPPVVPNVTAMSPRSPKVAGRRKRHAHAPLANLDALTDIMNEELSKSKENDFRLVPEQIDPNLPPPPKF